MSVIEIKNYTKKFDKVKAVDNINISVEEGDFYGFIGPNGAGKSTTINAMLNYIFPTKGSIKIFDLDSVKQSKLIKDLVGYVPSEVFYDDNMSVKDILKFVVSYNDNVDVSEIERYAKMFELDINKKFGELSLGTKKKVAIIQAIIHNPRLLILDEPTNGLDPIMQKKLFDVLTTLNKKGVTIFMSSHALGEVQKYCSKVAVIKQGKIVKVANISELLPHDSKVITIKCINSEDFKKNLDMRNINSLEIIDENNLKFIYSGNINLLFKNIYNIDIVDIDIETVSLEDLFNTYYEDEEVI